MSAIITFYKDYRELLESQFEMRVQRNRQYSLRSFAKDMDLTSGHLSDVLNRKSGISIGKAKAIARTLKLPSIVARYFALMVQSEHARSEKIRQDSLEEIQKLKNKFRENSVAYDQFCLVSDWLNFAILEVITSIDGDWSAARLAKYFNKSRDAVEECIQRLLRLDLVKLVGSKYVPTNARNSVAATPDKEAIRNYHASLISIARSQLFSAQRNKNEYSTTIVAIDPARVDEARLMIKNFWREFCEAMDDSKKKSDLYCLSVQLFNLCGDTHAIK